MTSLLIRCLVITPLCCHLATIRQVYNENPVPNIIEVGADYYIVAITSLCSKTAHVLDSHYIRLHLFLRYLVIYYRAEGAKGGGYTGLASYDVCHNSSLLTHVVVELLLSRTFRRSSIEREQLNIVAIISYLPFNLTTLLAQLLSDVPIPVFAIAIEDLFYLHNLNPSFMTVYSIIAEHLIVVNKQILNYGIRHVSLVIISGENLYFESTSRRIMWKLLRKHPDICISTKDINANNNTEVADYMRQIKRDNSLKMIMIWCGLDIQQFKNILYLTGGIKNRIWYWILDVNVASEIGYISKNISMEAHTFTAELLTSSVSMLMERGNYERLKKKYFRKDDNNILLNDTWISRYIEQNTLNTTTTSILSSFDECADSIDAEIAASFSPITLGYTLRNHTIGRLWELIKQVSRTKYSFRFVVNNQTNKITAVHGYTDFLRSELNDTIPQCEKIKCNPGNESKKKLINSSRNERKLNWFCDSCADGYMKSTDSNDSCVKCHDKLIPNKEKTSCINPYHEEYLKLGDTFSWILLAMIIPTAIFNITAIVTFLKYRKTPIIKSSGMKSSCVQLVAHWLIFVEIFILFFGKVNDVLCVAQVVVSGNLLTIIMSITIGKTQKLLFAFQSKVRLDHHTVLISKATEICISLVCVTTQVIISFVSMLGSCSLTQTSQSSDDLSQITFCKTKSNFLHQFTFIIVLSLFCCVQAFRSRNLPHYYNQAKQIVYAMYITIIIIAVRYPIIHSQDDGSQVFLNAVFILLINDTLLLLTFTQPVFVALFRKKKNTTHHFRNIIMKNIVEYSLDDIPGHSKGNRCQPDSSSINKYI